MASLFHLAVPSGALREMNFQSKSYKRARKEGYRSGLEVRIAADLKKSGIDAEYEPFKITYTEPETTHKYTPDYVLPNGIVIESKGMFKSSDRKKHKLIKAQHPRLDIRFVFSNAHAKIGKKSKTTYAMWCEANGIPWADKDVPEEWKREPKGLYRSMAIIKARKSQK